MERSKKSLEAKLKKLNDQSAKDDVVTFEELGVDRLFIDEADLFKNLYLYTKMRNVGGISQTESLKASDLYMKCQYMDEFTGGKGVVFATGTPVSNSMAELYTMQRYLQGNLLKELGLSHFDAWASQFGETVTSMELKPEGQGFQQKTRFSNFYNLPELMALFKEVADIQTADMLNLPVPKAKYETVVCKPSDIQKEMVEAWDNVQTRCAAGRWTLPGQYAPHHQRWPQAGIGSAAAQPPAAGYGGQQGERLRGESLPDLEELPERPADAVGVLRPLHAKNGRLL